MSNPSRTKWTEEFKHPIDFLLEEDGVTFIAQEDGVSLLVLEQTGSTISLWTDQVLH